MSTSKKRFCKDSSYSVTIIEKLKVTNRTDQNGMDKSSQPLRKAKKRYWMMELRTLYPYSKKTKMKTENIHNNVGKKFPSLLKKQNRVNCWSLHKGFLNVHHMNLIANLIQHSTLILEMCLTLYEPFSLAWERNLKSTNEVLSKVLKNK